MIVQSKTAVARSQLGAALQLFLDDADPISIQSLACAGGEIAAGLARSENKTTFSELAASASRKSLKEIRKERNEFWNAFKHYYASDGKSERDDSALIKKFFEDPDFNNATNLWIGWYDYMMAGNPLPVEFQVFQIWFWALDLDRLSDNHDKTYYQELFPALSAKTRPEQKRLLIHTIREFKEDREILSDPKTDSRPLVLPAASFLQNQ